MNLSVGVLYDAKEFLKDVKSTAVTPREFGQAFPTFRVASGKRVLEMAQALDWVQLSENKILDLTEKGIRIEACKSSAAALRLQLEDFILATKPPWASLIPKGRAETVDYLSKDVEQCFREAALLDGTSDEVVRWWDSLAKAARGRKEDVNLDTGREGERRSIDYERQRTGSTPFWQSIESNLAGYDLLSKIDQNDSAKLLIEVKASTQTVGATLHLTRNEWDTACAARAHVFHLWLLRSTPRLRVVEREEMKRHVPRDEGIGEWESVRVPFSAFCHLEAIEISQQKTG